MINMIL